jgi:hypothetical protein
MYLPNALSPPDHLPTAFSPSLAVDGLVCDCITVVGAPEVEWNPRHGKWAYLSISSSLDHPTGVSRVQAFFRMMIADVSGLGFGRPDFNNRHERDQFSILQKGFMIYAGIISKQQYQATSGLREQGQRWHVNTSERNHKYAAYLQLFLGLVPDGPTSHADAELLQPFVESLSSYG